MRSPALALLAAILTTFPLVSCGRPPAPPSYGQNPLAPAPAPKPLPDFQRRTLDGTPADTKALRGRVVVVKFFAKYCEPCKQTLPWMQSFAESHKDVAVIGVAEDERESDVRDVVGTYKLSFPVVHDAGNVLAGRFRVTDMPVTFVADGQGNIRWVGGPGQSEADLRQAVSASAP